MTLAGRRDGGRLVGREEVLQEDFILAVFIHAGIVGREAGTFKVFWNEAKKR